MTLGVPDLNLEIRRSSIVVQSNYIAYCRFSMAEVKDAAVVVEAFVPDVQLEGSDAAPFPVVNVDVVVGAVKVDPGKPAGGAICGNSGDICGDWAELVRKRGCGG